MRSYRQDRWARAWQAIAPETIPPILRFLLLVLLGLVGGIPCMILIVLARVIKWILLSLNAMGEKTWMSIRIILSDPDS